MSEQAPKGPRTFQVTIPSGSAEQILALDGLADAFHWQIRDADDRTIVDLPELDEDGILTEPDFLIASQEMWGTDVHGKVAHGLLQGIRSRVTSNGHASAGYSGRVSDISVYIPDSSFHHAAGSNPIADITMDTKVIDARILREVETRKLPFGVVMQHPHPEGNQKHHRNIFVPTLLDKKHLEQFVIHRGYHEHRYHEAVGKAIDVMLAVAEVEPTSNHDRTSDTEFVDRKDVISMLVANGTTRPQADGFFKIVRNVVKSQLAMRPEHAEEVIVAGAIELMWDGAEIKLVDQLGLASLKPLAPLSTNQRIKELVSDLDWNLQSWREAQASSAQ
jgi:hypothetical protein